MDKTMKRLLSFVIVAVMVFGMIVPATPLHAHATTITADSTYVDYQNFGKEVADAAAQIQFPTATEAKDAEGKYFIADCPACGAKDATWLARGEGSAYAATEGNSNIISAAAGCHYYLVGDLVRLDTSNITSGTVCVHLNKFDIIATATDKTGCAINVGGSVVLNMMGEGTVAGNRSDGDTPSKTANIYGSATLNLYGGTYSQADTAANEAVFGNYAYSASTSLNLFAGAEIVGVNTGAANASAVRWESGTLNMYGGRISGTKGEGNGNLIFLKGGNLNIYGGEIVVTENSGGDILAQGGNITIAGNPVVGKLYRTGSVLTIGELTAGASIGYSQPNSMNPRVAVGKGTYAGKYIYAYENGGAVINANTGNLTYAAPTLGTGNNTYCPYCDAEISAWNDLQYYSVMYESRLNGHYKLTKATTKAAAVGVSGDVCLYLNGFDLSNSYEGTEDKYKHMLTLEKPTADNENKVPDLTVMGKGTISGKRSTSSGGVVVNFLSGTLRMYGATLTKDASLAETSVQLLLIGADRTLIVGDGATISAPADARAVTTSGGTLILDGGKIDGLIVANGTTSNITANSGVMTRLQKDGGTLTINSGTYPNMTATTNAAAGKCVKYVGNTIVVNAAHTADAATCYSASVCERCNTELAAALDHDYSEGACANCDKTRCQVEGHAMVSLEGQEATCTEAGLTDSWECSRCDYAAWEQTEIPAAHKYVDGTCSVCGYNQCNDGHTPGEITIENETETSYDKVYTCQVCEQPFRDTIQKTTVTDALAFVGETNVAYCPVCETDVEWEALVAANTTLEAGKHYYVPAEVELSTGSGACLTVPKNGTVCAHLNGQNVTLAEGMKLVGFEADTKDYVSGTINLMGNGTAAVKSTAGLFDMGNGGTANVYAGAYYNTNVNGFGAIMQTSTLTVKADAVIGTADYPSVIELRHSTGNADLRVEGGNIQSIVLKNDNSITLSGASVINNLSIPAGKTITVGALTEGADITVDAEGAFTAAIENAEAVAAYFSAVESDKKEVTVVEGALAVTNKETYKPAPETGYADNLIFSETTENSAWCAACGEEVIWTPWDGTTQLYLGSDAKGHYYLPDDVEYTAGTAIHIDTAELCFHLNGHDLTSTAGKVIVTGTAGSVINVLGTGTVSGADSANGATIQHPYGGKLNLYSGTYTKAETASGGSTNVIRLNRGGSLYLGDAATIIDPLKESSTPAIYSDSATSSYVVDGAVVDGTFSCTGGQSITVSGDAQLEYLVLKNGNKVTVGELTEGAQIGIGITGRDGADAVFADNAEQNAQYFVAGKPDDCHVIPVDGALALGDHAPQITNTKAEVTCTEDGLVDHVCTVCGYEAFDVVIEATGHTAGAEATCTEDQICTVCQEVITKAPGHQGATVEIKVIEATCTEAGSREIFTECEVCGEVMFDGVEEIPALGHKYEDGECVNCGEAEPKDPVAQVGEEKFTSVEAALLRAEELGGGTVQLIGDGKTPIVADELIRLRANVILDLAGNTLIANDEVQATKSNSYIMDSTDCAGKLVIAEENLLLIQSTPETLASQPSPISYIPYKDAEGNYHFAKAQLSGPSKLTLSGGVYTSKALFYNGNTSATLKSLMTGASGSASAIGISVRVKVTGEQAGNGRTFYFYYNDEYIRGRTNSSNPVKMEVSGVDSFENLKITTELVFGAGTGAEVIVAGRSYGLNDV